MEDRCFICGDDNPTVLEEHHLVPRRFGGKDSRSNTVTLCSNCHTAIEKLYDKDFYVSLAEKTESCPFCGQSFIDSDVKRHIKRMDGGGHGDYGELPEDYDMVF